jgi:Xaa-Pro dipeptidase
LLCHAFANINYLTGLETVGYYGCGRITLLVPRRGDPTILATHFELQNARLSAWTKDNVPYPTGGDFFDALGPLLTDRKLAKARIGIDQSFHGFTIRDVSRLRRLLPKAAFADATDLVPSVRRVKSPAELGTIQKAARLSSAGIVAAMDRAAPGVTDNELAAAGYEAMIGGGSEYPSIAPVVTVGPRSGIPHSTFQRVRLRRGDAILLEFSGCIHRYHAPIMRGVSVGRPTDNLRRMADGCIASIDRVIELMKPGAIGGEIAAQALSALKKAVPNLDALIWHGCYGYSTGIGFPPHWDDGGDGIMIGSRDVLLPGMVFHVNTSLRDIGRCGTAFSETVAITASGHKVMTRAPRVLAVR